MGRSYQTGVPGMSATDISITGWTLPWEIAPEILRLAGYAAAAVIRVSALWLIWRAVRLSHPSGPILTQKSFDYEAALYLWILVSLVVFPHMERYNHVLLLPAGAWLWGKGRYSAVIWAYFLTALSRLTHLWADIAPTLVAFEHRQRPACHPSLGQRYTLGDKSIPQSGGKTAVISSPYILDARTATAHFPGIGRYVRSLADNDSLRYFYGKNYSQRAATFLDSLLGFFDKAQTKSYNQCKTLLMQKWRG